MPFTCANHVKTLLGGKFDSNKFATVFSESASHPIKAFKSIVKNNLMGQFLKNFFGFTLLYVLCVGIGIIKLMPKHRYDDIEHGSSDWRTWRTI